MPTLDANGITQHYELAGDPAKPPVLLISGLGGMAASWGSLPAHLTQKYHVILPDQRGTGRTSRAAGGYSTEQLAADMAVLVKHLGVGPVHVIGASTGGAIGQYLALDHPTAVASLTMVSSFARFDAFVRREFELRRKAAAEWDRAAQYSCYALFLFSPQFARMQPDRVQAWIDRVLAGPVGPDDQRIALARIDMIAAHDTLPRLAEIGQPVLVLAGGHDFCTPVALSEEIAAAIPGAELVVFPGAGHFVEIEREADFLAHVTGFIDRSVVGTARAR
jgi:aminoacrylate hydrolase